MTNSKLTVKNSYTRKASAKPSAVERTVKRTAKASNYAFAKPGVVPPGEYRSKIVGMEETMTRAGEEAVDVLYELTDSSGKQYHIRARYPTDGYYFDKLCDALLNAGLPDGSKLSDGIGIEEEVTLDYPDGGRIGNFVDRRPVNSAATGRKSAGSNSRVVEDVDEDDEDTELENFLQEDDD